MEWQRQVELKGRDGRVSERGYGHMAGRQCYLVNAKLSVLGACRAPVERVETGPRAVSVVDWVEGGPRSEAGPW